TVEQKAALTQSQLDERAIADKVRAMTQSQFASLPADQMKYLSTEQLSAVTDAWWFSQIPAQSLQALSQAQISALPASIAGASVGKLSTEQITWLNPPQIQAVTPGYAIADMIQKAPEFITLITPGQLATFKDPYNIGRLIQTAGSHLSKEQFQAMPQSALHAMTQAQVTAIPASVYDKIKDSLTATQQAWRP
ncbi:MAG: hypothetical protein ACE5DZ_07670, partial [Mariprofundus sp.]